MQYSPKVSSVIKDELRQKFVFQISSILLVFSFFLPPLYSNQDSYTNDKVLLLDENIESYLKGAFELENYLEILPDVGQDYTIEDIRSDSFDDKFTNDLTGLDNLENYNAVYWLRLTIKSKLSNDEKWLISFNNPEFTVYTADEVFSSGTHTDRKKETSISHYIPYAPLIIHQDEELVLYIRIRSKTMANTGHAFLDQLDKTFFTENYLIQFNNREKRSSNFILGIMFTVFFYHLILFYYNREKVYLWLSLFALSFLVINGYYTGLIFELFKVDYSKNIFEIFYFLVWIIYLTIVPFYHAILNSKQTQLWCYYLVNLLASLIIIISFAHIIIFLIQGNLININEYHLIKILLLLLVAFNPILLITSSYAALKGNKDALYLVASFSFLLIQATMNIYYANSSVDSSIYFSRYLGMAATMLLLSFGLARKYRTLKDEKLEAEIQKERAKQEKLFHSAEAKRLEDLSHTKNQFFTNITHEFRTPLTIINGLTQHSDLQEDKKEVILRNSQSLLDLVDQILTISKLDSGVMPLINSEIDLANMLKIWTSSFSSLASKKNISLNFHSDFSQLKCSCDKEKVKTIVTNLISNAIKYTPQYGNVLVVLKLVKNKIIISVKDNGVGLSEEEQNKVFDKFYRSPSSDVEGTGIGLALAKEMSKIIGGKLGVESTLGHGSTFTLEFVFVPGLTLSAPKENPNDQKSLTIAIDNDSNDPMLQSTVLIIEDNFDLIEFISELLSKEFTVITARNGKKGLDQAKNKIPDIIISDIMMPEMDGIEVCSNLKANITTSHIPIIMLTAKADQKSKLEGLGVGADMYLTKPFDEQELLVTIENLLSARKKYQQYYAANTPNVDTSDPENVFIHKLETIIEQNLSDENFTMSQLCDILHLERSQLYRKVKALTGTTPAKMIKERRLAKAHKLLKSQKGTITEITYQCGFKDVSYFSKQFKEAYGKSPSQLLAAK